MTRGARNGLILAAVHLAIVASLGVKLVADRAALPRVWVRAAPYDPQMPIRGRYVSLTPEIDTFVGVGRPRTDGTSAFSRWAPRTPVQLTVRNGELVAAAAKEDTGVWGATAMRRDGTVTLRLQPIPFFIPEGIPDPSMRPAGEELWVEVSVPRHGTPRPIQLGVKKNGRLASLALR